MQVCSSTDVASFTKLQEIPAKVAIRPAAPPDPAPVGALVLPREVSKPMRFLGRAGAVGLGILTSMVRPSVLAVVAGVALFGSPAPAKASGIEELTAAAAGAAAQVLASDDQLKSAQLKRAGKGYRPPLHPEIVRADNYDPQLDGTTTIRGDLQTDAFVNALVKSGKLRAERADRERSFAIYKAAEGVLQAVDITSTTRQRGAQTETVSDLSLMPPGTSASLVAIAHSHPRESSGQHSVGKGDDGVLLMWGVPNYVTWGDSKEARVYVLERDNGQYQYRQVSGQRLPQAEPRELGRRTTPYSQTEKFLREMQQRARETP